MARYTCPSCGASYNGRRCRACFYENFSEEIPHGAHVHQGEPLVIDAPARRPIPKKDPFGCDKPSRKPVFPRREKKQRPFAGLLTIFLLIYSFLPLVRNWGLELEARETAAQMEMVLPEDLVELFHQKPVTICLPQGELADLTDGIRLWIRNDSSRDLSVQLKQLSANGSVMEGATLLLEASAESWGMGTLYLNETPPESPDGNLTVTFTLQIADALDMVLMDTHPISLVSDS